MVEASAPSNIALIKYMGKIESHGNVPTNSSLSYTLPHLRTQVILKSLEENSTKDVLVSLGQGGYSVSLSEKGEKRFLVFFEKLKNEFELPGFYKIESGNNFPSDCGLASSASSFAALTMAANEMSRKMGLTSVRSAKDLAALSQTGSGSSCRSFFAPFSIWTASGAEAIDLGISNLNHSVLILEDQQKTVSSSEAHRRVSSSLLFQGRIERAEIRMDKLIDTLRSGDWKSSYEICWQEFWDMHALFETSSDPFGYMNKSTIEALKILRDFWNQNMDGPLVTMDAGPNIHLLFREDQVQLHSNLISELKQNISNLQVMSS